MERKDKNIGYMKTLFAVDDSGSVNGKSLYFNKIKDLLETYFNKERGDSFYIWDDKYKQLGFEEINNFINKMEGCCNTYSSLIAEISKKEKNNKFEHLIIISDGEVDSNEIDKSDII